MTLDLGMDDAFTGGDGPPPPQEESEDYKYPDVGVWVTEWLAPATALKLSDGGRGRTWCAKWFEHPPIVVRLNELWHAWEKAVRSGDDHALHGWYVYDYDATMRALTDGEYGPMHACSPTKHRDIPCLPVEPVPPGFFTTNTTTLITVISAPPRSAPTTEE
ncbi:DUF4913 domain-containing protein [Nocardia sp. NBC_01327]|uniref:DUF4913 domain-containing protein n=1 Tax=Nocardia sp. NBC_01327 TaxID=2903593 RepID=UPI002E1628AC|nr:DUF4913 domain-containing protein [Nocardia sp. NBC_01327]